VLNESNKTVMVAGGAGFLGSNLCEQLLKNNYYVLCVDNLSTSQLSNIEGFRNHPKFDFMRHDITQPLYVEVDEIYNLACPASPVNYQSDPIQTMKTSVLGSINLLGIAKRNKAKILLASTSEIYGDPKVHPQHESYWGNVNTIGIRSCYDEGKRAAETLFFDYKRQHDVEIKIARIFNTYGPRMQPNDGRVVSNFIVQALSGNDITVYGDGSQTRSFCYVDDLIGGLMAIMATDKNITGPINIGNPDEFTMNELARIVLGKVGGNSKIKYKSLPEDDPKQRKPDISLANKILNWQPHVKLDYGLEQTIEYFKKLNVK